MPSTCVRPLSGDTERGQALFSDRDNQNGARRKKMKKKKLGFNRLKAIGLVVIAMIALSAIAELVWVTCPRCNGRKFLCSYCNGTGQMRCTVCNGTGMFMGWACTACTGGKRMCTNCVMAPECPRCNTAGGYWVNK